MVSIVRYSKPVEFNHLSEDMGLIFVLNFVILIPQVICACWNVSTVDTFFWKRCTLFWISKMIQQIWIFFLFIIKLTHSTRAHTNVWYTYIQLVKSLRVFLLKKTHSKDTMYQKSEYNFEMITQGKIQLHCLSTNDYQKTIWSATLVGQPKTDVISCTDHCCKCLTEIIRICYWAIVETIAAWMRTCGWYNTASSSSVRITVSIICSYWTWFKTTILPQLYPVGVGDWNVI